MPHVLLRYSRCQKSTKGVVEPSKFWNFPQEYGGASFRDTNDRIYIHIYIYIVVPIDIDIGMYRWLKREGGRVRNIHTYTRIKRNIENSGHLFHANSSEAASISLWEREREKTVRAFDFTRVISTRYGLSSKCYQLRYENYKINQRLRWKEAKYSSHVARKLKYGQSVSVS